MVTRWAPDPVRDFLRVAADDAVKDWPKLRAAIRGFYARGVIYTGTGRTAGSAKVHALTSAVVPSKPQPQSQGSRQKPWKQGARWKQQPQL